MLPRDRLRRGNTAGHLYQHLGVFTAWLRRTTTTPTTNETRTGPAASALACGGMTLRGPCKFLSCKAWRVLLNQES